MPQVALTKDQFQNLIQDTYGDRSFRGEYDGSNNLIYAGFALPGSSTADAVWQIKKLNYTSNNLVSIVWPELNSKANTGYNFIWNNRAALTYA